tara:strand:- start:281 stop:799 length:519 start_codon:yes stop_codon:yes gene_type:complete
MMRRSMEHTIGKTTIYDWLLDQYLVNEIALSISEIEESKLLSKKNSYEKDMCDILGWKDARGRHKDAIAGDGTGVELKKSAGSFIFDGVRYAEMYITKEEDNGIHVLFNFNKHGVTRVFIVPNWMMVKLIIPRLDIAELELSLFKTRKEMKQGLNSQAMMTSNQMIQALNAM